MKDDYTTTVSEAAAHAREWADRDDPEGDLPPECESCGATGDWERCPACGHRQGEPCPECKGRGWDVFDSDSRGLEVERCDSCGVLADDSAALLAALRWWVDGGYDADNRALRQAGMLSREWLLFALLNGAAGLAIAALEPVVDRG